LVIGKVFENLLGTFNEETKTTARNESGSFYTPREIVDYMVDASLKEYFKEKLHSNDTITEEKLDNLFSYSKEEHDFDSEQVKILMNSINNCKILDPACGSGAFPMGILNRFLYIMQKLDPDNILWKELQIKKVMEATKIAYGIDNKEKRKERLAEIDEVFEMSTGEFSNYARKLYLIENCIFGVDIQPIAIQISKLRFFISLIVDQKTSGNKKNNYNVLPLPNLETKFVAANTLIGVKREQGFLADPDIELKQNELLYIRHCHFSARYAIEKIHLRRKDELLSKELSKLLIKDGFYTSSAAEQLANWNPYDQSKSSDFFDPAWMFGLSNENTRLNCAGFFDVVIWNPPYVSAPTMVSINPENRKAIINSHCYTTLYQKWDLFIPFMDLGLQLLSEKGIFTMIIPYPFTNQSYAKKMREFIVNQFNLLEIAYYDTLEHKICKHLNKNVKHLNNIPGI